MSSRRSSACTSGHLATPAAPSPQPPTKVERRIFVTPGPSPTRRDRPALVPRRRAPPRLSSADHKVLRAPGLSSRVPSTALLVLRANINCARRGACARRPRRVGGPRLEPSSSSSSWLGRDSSRCQWAVRRTNRSRAVRRAAPRISPFRGGASCASPRKPSSNTSADDGGRAPATGSGPSPTR